MFKIIFIFSHFFLLFQLNAQESTDLLRYYSYLENRVKPYEEKLRILLSRTDQDITGMYDSETLKAIERTRYFKEVVLTHNTIGGMYFKLGEYGKALDVLEQGYKLGMKNLADYDDEINSCSDLTSEILVEIGEVQTGISFLNQRKAILLKSQPKYKIRLWGVYSILGRLYMFASKYDEAIECFNLAALCFEGVPQIAKKGKYAMLRFITDCYLAKNDPEKALETLKKSEINSLSSIIYANIFQVLGQYDSALVYIKKSIEKDKEERIFLDESSKTARKYNQAASIYFSMGELDSAYYYSKCAMNFLLKDQGSHYSYEESLLTILHQRVLIEHQLFNKTHNLQYLENASENILSACSVYVRHKAFMLTLSGKKEVTTSFRRIFKDAANIFIELYKRKKNEEELKKLLWVLEIDRNFTLNQISTLNRFISKNKLENDSLFIEFRKVQRNIQHFWSTQNDTSSLNRDIKNQIKERLFPASSIYIKSSRLFREIIKKYPDIYKDFDLPTYEIVSEIQSNLGDNVIIDFHPIINYRPFVRNLFGFYLQLEDNKTTPDEHRLIGADKNGGSVGDTLLMFYLTKKSISVNVIQNYSKLREDINGFNIAIRKNMETKAKSYNDKLYNLLLPKELSYPNKSGQLEKDKRLIIITDSFLSHLPFDALYNKSRKKYLIEDIPILYHYSLYSWQNGILYSDISGYNRINKDSITGSGDSFRYDYVGYTPYDETETDKYGQGDNIKNEFLPFAIAEIESAKNSLIKAGKNAIVLESKCHNKSSVLNYMTSVNTLHLVTHFHVNEKNPTSSVIRFRNEDLTIDELIKTDRINVGTFVLSGCFGASEAEIEKDEINSIGKISLYLNAKNFVSSIWRMMDKPTSVLMSDFFVHLSEGSSPSDALRKAKINMIKSKEYALPLFWAGFRCYGVE